MTRRVLVALHEEELGGASRAVLRCVAGLEERGYEFIFWVPPGPLAEQLREEGREVSGWWRPVAYSLRALRLEPGALARARALPRYVRAFRAELRRSRPAIVHANSHVTLLDAWLARRAGFPTLLHIHEMFGDGRKWALGRRAAFGCADVVVAVSDACADALATGAHRPLVIRNGVPPPASRRVERTPGEVRVGTVGALSRRKGTDVFVEAARLAGARDPQLRFELIGAASEPLDREWALGVVARARAAGIEHREHADVGDRLSHWDMAVFPSRRDPFPLASLEAMAAGLPVVASAVDGLREQLTDDTGVMVPPDDPAALAEAIVALAASPEARNRIGRAASERVAESFTIERQVDALDAAYRATLDSRRRA